MKTIYIVVCNDELTTLHNKSQIKDALEAYGVTVSDEQVLKSMYATMNNGDAYTKFTSDDGVDFVNVYEQRV